MELVFASNNKNKIKEIQLLLPNSITILSLEDIGCFEEIEENASTIEGNAILKANYVTTKYGHNCFADDSGLEVEILNGKPGVHSARYAGEQRNDADNMDKLLAKLEFVTNRKANFKTVIALNLDGKQTLFTGIIDGIITKEKIGTNGFGYDPLFKPNNCDITFGQFEIEEKARISHRGIAVKQLITYLNNL
ncbi:non-canonical purine NTP diphosphatase [Flavobacterium sp.]|uniref:non-canonical purine NTP diphosphatase n=1 Tax=Flavobacterium sp. TaxID=239 RepID=UPI003752676F